MILISPASRRELNITGVHVHREVVCGECMDIHLSPGTPVINLSRTQSETPASRLPSERIQWELPGAEERITQERSVRYPSRPDPNPDRMRPRISARDLKASGARNLPHQGHCSCQCLFLACGSWEFRGQI